MRFEQVGARVDVRRVPDDDLRVAHRRLGRRGAQRGRAGPEPDDAQPARGTGTAGDRHRGDGVRLLGHHELGARPGGQERGGLGDARRADGVGDDRARGRHRYGAQRLRRRIPGAAARGPADPARSSSDRASRPRRSTGAREPGGVEGVVEEVGHGVRRRARRGADPGDERRWVQRRPTPGPAATRRSVTRMHSGPSPPVKSGGQRPAQLVGDARRPPVEHGGRHGGDVADGDEARQRVERDAAGAVRRGGEHRLGVEEPADLTGERRWLRRRGRRRARPRAARLRRRRRRRGHGSCRRAAARRSGPPRRWRGTARSRRPSPIARARWRPPTRGRARTAGGAPEPGPPPSPTRSGPTGSSLGPPDDEHRVLGLEPHPAGDRPPAGDRHLGEVAEALVRRPRRDRAPRTWRRRGRPGAGGRGRRRAPPIPPPPTKTRSGSGSASSAPGASPWTTSSVAPCACAFASMRRMSSARRSTATTRNPGSDRRDLDGDTPAARAHVPHHAAVGQRELAERDGAHFRLRDEPIARREALLRPPPLERRCLRHPVALEEHDDRHRVERRRPRAPRA